MPAPNGNAAFLFDFTVQILERRDGRIGFRRPVLRHHDVKRVRGERRNGFRRQPTIIEDRLGDGRESSRFRPRAIRIPDSRLAR